MNTCFQLQNYERNVATPEDAGTKFEDDPAETEDEPAKSEDEPAKFEGSLGKSAFVPLNFTINLPKPAGDSWISWLFWILRGQSFRLRSDVEP